MGAFLNDVFQLILSAIRDFSEEHSAVSVSSCGVVCFDLRDGSPDSDAKAIPSGPPAAKSGLLFLERPAPTSGD